MEGFDCAQGFDGALQACGVLGREGEGAVDGDGVAVVYGDGVEFGNDGVDFMDGGVFVLLGGFVAGLVLEDGEGAAEFGKGL